MNMITFEGLLVEIDADPDLLPKRQRDLASAVRTFTKNLDIDPLSSAAGIEPYRRRLERFSPASANMKEHTWSTVRSNVRFVLARYGIIDRRPKPNDLNPNWRDLREHASRADIRLVRGLSALIHFCSAQGIEPEDVDDEALDRFRGYLVNDTFTKSVNSKHRQTCDLWNRACAAVPGWPQRRVRKPVYHNHFSFPLTAFPESFQQEFQRWDDRLAGDDLFDPGAPDRPQSPRTRHTEREQVRRFASALVLSGHDINGITSLADLVVPEHFRQALTYLLERHGGPKRHLRNQASTLIYIAKRWVEADDHVLETLKAMRKQLRCPRAGLTPKNKTILRQFNDPLNVAKIVNLPDRLLAEAKKRKNPNKAALLVQTALAIEILLIAPIRLRNLLTLGFDAHLAYSRAGRKGVVHIVIPGEEVKNDEPLEFELPKSTVELLEYYRRIFRPRLSAGESTWFFPGEGGHKHESTLSGQIVKAIHKFTGLTLTVHVFRHLAAKLYLDENPGDYETVRRLLGHRSIATTINFYTEFETIAAFKRYDDVIQRHRKQLVRNLRKER